ncbi:MAG: NAD(P)/FAD-dependent oxidoreductase [Verrucomicrobiae bacterium]|nr:NAD(P)/FAD-dependent oxidoreductase [Verrucomicrobiae bacterium]
MNTPANDQRPHILVLGAGFAGLEFCQAMRGHDEFRVTLVDRQNHHLFQPLLYQVASAGLAAPEIAHPVRSVFSDDENVTVLMDEVRSIDLENKTVKMRDRELVYDYLVIGLGVRTGYFGHDEWATHTIGLKSLDDATQMRRRVLMAFEQAEMCDDPEERERLMTIVIVGGGPTGVELAGAFAELARHVLRSDFRRIDTDNAKIVLVEALPRLLSMYDEDLSEYTRRKLEAMGVTVLTESPVQNVRERAIELPERTLEAENIVWAAGVQAVPLTNTLGVETDKAGRITVEKDLSIPGHPEVFAVGDIADCVDQAEVRVPGLCPAAMQMGRHAARVIMDEWKRKQRRGKGSGYEVRPQFRYFDKGSMATIGRSAAVASSMGMKFKGFIAWLMWLFIHLMFLVGFRNKLAVLLQWFYAYVRYRRGARIITGLGVKEDS